MTPPDAPEFTRRQGLVVAFLAGLFGVCLSLLVGDQTFQVGMIAFGTITATIFIQRPLVRQPPFLLFLAVVVAAHIAFMITSPMAPLERGEFRMLAIADLAVVIGLSFVVERLISRRR